MPASTQKKTQLTPKEKAMRRAWAVRLKFSGATYQHIAETCGYYSRAVAYRDVIKGMELDLGEADRPTGEMRLLLLARLELLTSFLWPAAAEGDAQASRTILRAIAQQTILYGLNDPKRLDETVSQNHDAELTHVLKILTEGERLKLETARAELDAARTSLEAERIALATEREALTVPAPRARRPARRP